MDFKPVLMRFEPTPDVFVLMVGGAGFIGEYQRPVLRVRFFLMLGYVYRCQRSRSAASALANMRFGRCTEKPMSWRIFRT